MGKMINVTKNGKYYFRTYVVEERAEQIYKDIKARFPKADGYNATIEDNIISYKDIEWLSAILTTDYPDDVKLETIKETILEKKGDNNDRQ